MLIDDQICKVGGEELFLLLGVSLGAVDRVESLDLSLHVQCQSYFSMDVFGVSSTYGIVVACSNQRIVGVLARLEDDA